MDRPTSKLRFIDWKYAKSSLVLLSLLGTLNLAAQEAPRFTTIKVQTNQEVLLNYSVSNKLNFRLEASTTPNVWSSLSTLVGSNVNQYLDSGAPYRDHRFYRLVQFNESNLFTGDHLQTDDGEIVFHPINHASFVMKWNDIVIFNDPVGASSLYSTFGKPNLILVSHDHGDHFSSSTISAVKGENTTIVAPLKVFNGLSTALRASTIVLTNNMSTNLLGIQIDAIPAYNTSNSNHPKGVGNGYVLTIAGKRIYMSGDTEDIPEIRALQNIDVAFLCMNIPYTMSGDKAAAITRQFIPGVVYPYHFQNQGGGLTDLNKYKRTVDQDLGTEVRLRKWY
jgi:L-ascorbate metabolism protein UlaG (beta-lactamase superfamily)